MFTRTGGALTGPTMEALEPRLLLDGAAGAVHIADFFPLNSGAQWHYSGTAGGMKGAVDVNVWSNTYGGTTTARRTYTSADPYDPGELWENYTSGRTG